MASTLTWSEAALQDLEGIAAYIAKDSPHYAATTIGNIVDAVERLQDHPQIGRVVPEYSDSTLRMIIWRQYRIVYRVMPGQIFIVAVIHGARLLPESPEEPLA
ncbi:MAG: type II toxin-antitoxin system RelE/ParE family toxin [Phycisphaerae bacterium]|nr:type II toxin-antitoxin system RelE/ParE family toxin [Phycisphaerae bacterium]